MICQHQWEDKGRSDHAFERNVIMVRCMTCGQDGYRRKPGGVVFTWSAQGAKEQGNGV